MRTRLIFAIGRPVCWVFMRVLYHLRIEGAEHIPREGPVIVASNHQSHYDPIFVGLVAWSRLFRPIARSGLFRRKPLAFILWLFNTISIDQESRRGDMNAIRSAIAEVQSGRALVLYPEGSRTTDGVVHELERGLMVVWRRTKATVSPVVIEGAYDVWPPHQRFPRLSGRVVVHAGKPIEWSEVADKEDDEVLDMLRRWFEERRLALRRELRHRSRGKYPLEHDGDRAFWDDGAGGTYKP